MYYLKIFLQKIYPPFIFALIKYLQRAYYFKKNSGYSREEATIYKYITHLNIEEKNKFAVDIAAQDGILGSQTLNLFKKNWSGIALEVDGQYFSSLSWFYRCFSKVTLIKTKVTPFNVVDILKVVNCPYDFGFLSLDIDSFDYYVLDKILKEYRPQLVCVEINENVPPPIKFTVLFSNDFSWDGLDSHFQGQSIEMVNELCLKYNYKIIDLHYNNLFIVPLEKIQFKTITSQDAYNHGYFLKSDRKRHFPWNHDMEILFSLKTDEQVKFLKKKFEKYEGKYILEL